jgi:hypothetical protein
MLKSALVAVMLVAAPAFAQEPRADFAAVKALVAQAVEIAKRPEAPISVTDEVAKQLHRAPATRLKNAR